MQIRHKKPSHTFTIKAQGIENVLLLDIELVQIDIPFKRFKTKGIWDTGATHTVITQEAMDFLELKPQGKRMVSTATVSNESKPTYLIDVFLNPGLKITAVEVTVGTIAAEHGIDCLIGMDIINLGDFSITNLGGQTCMSFRIPSQHEVDFGKKLQSEMAVVKQHTDAGRGMNQKCICGSGKKFKNCHGRDYEEF